MMKKLNEDIMYSNLRELVYGLMGYFYSYCDDDYFYLKKVAYTQKDYNDAFKLYLLVSEKFIVDTLVDKLPISVAAEYSQPTFEYQLYNSIKDIFYSIQEDYLGTEKIFTPNELWAEFSSRCSYVDLIEREIKPNLDPRVEYIIKEKRIG